MRIRLLNESEARRLISPTQAIASCRDAFAKLALGQVELPDVLTIEVKEQRGEVHAKGGNLHGAPRFAIKIATRFYNNPAHGLPTSSGGV